MGNSSTVTNVLIVDDHPPMRLVIRLQLSQVLGVAQVFEADNGHEAVQLVRHAQPGLVLLDLDLPRLNGLDAIPRIQRLQPAVRILVISAQSAAVYAPRVQTAGAHGFISKTRHIPDILRAIEAVLSGYKVYPDHGRADVPANDAETARLVGRLSDREIMVMQMLVRGMSNKEIGKTLYISNKTVSTYKTRLMRKLGVGSLVELVDLARKHQISY